MIKRIVTFSLFLLLYATYSAEAISYGPYDDVRIRNRTGKEIFIEIEYWEEPLEYGGDMGRFHKELDGVEIFFVVFFMSPIARLEPNRAGLLMNYRPSRALEDIYAKMRAMPLLEKIRLLIKVLRITNAEGDLLFSLEDANEDDFTFEVENPTSIFPGFTYSLYIF